MSTTPVSLLRVLGNAFIFIVCIAQFVIEFYFTETSRIFQYMLFIISILLHIIEFPAISYYGIFLRSYEEAIFFGCTLSNLIVTCITTGLYWCGMEFKNGIIAGMFVFIIASYISYSYHILRRRIRSLMFLNKLEDDQYYFLNISVTKVSQLAVDGIAIMHPYLTSMKFFNILLEYGEPSKLDHFARIALIFYAIQPYYDEQMKAALNQIDSKYRTEQANMLSIHRDMSLSEELKRQIEIIQPSIKTAQTAVGKFYESAVMDSQRDMLKQFHRTSALCRHAREQITRLVNSFPNNQFALMYAARFYTKVMGNANLAADFYEKAHCTVYYQNDDIPFKSEQNLFKAYPRVVAHHYEAPVEGDPIARDLQADPGEYHDSIKMNLCSFSERLTFPSVVGLIAPYTIISIGITIACIIVTAGWNNQFFYERTLLIQYTHETELIRTHMREIQVVVSLAILESNGMVSNTNFSEDFHTLYNSIISTFHTLTNIRYLEFRDPRLIRARDTLFQPSINFTDYKSDGIKNDVKKMSAEEMTYNLLAESLDIISDPKSSFNSSSIETLYTNAPALFDAYHSIFLEMGDYIIKENRVKKGGLITLYILLLILIITLFTIMIILPKKFIIKDCFNIIRSFRSVPKAALIYVSQKVSNNESDFSQSTTEEEKAFRTLKPHEDPVGTSRIKFSGLYVVVLLAIAALQIAQVLTSAAHFFIVGIDVGNVFKYNYDIVDSYYNTIEAIGTVLTYAAHPVIQMSDQWKDVSEIVSSNIDQATAGLDRTFFGTGPTPSICTVIPTTKKLIFNTKNPQPGVNYPSNVDRFMFMIQFISQVNIEYIRLNESIDHNRVDISKLWSAARDYVFPRLFDSLLEEVHTAGSRAASSWMTLCIVIVSIGGVLSSLLTIILLIFYRSEVKDMKTILELIFHVPTKTILKSRYITTLITEDFRVLPTDFLINTDSASSIIINTPSPVIMINTETETAQVNKKAEEIGIGREIDPFFLLGTCLNQDSEKVLLLGKSYIVNVSNAANNLCYVLTDLNRLKLTEEKLKREEIRQDLIIKRVTPVGITDKLMQVDSIVASIHLIRGSMDRVASVLEKEKETSQFFDYYSIVNNRCYLFFGLVSRAARSDISKDAIRSCLNIIDMLRVEKFSFNKRYEGRFERVRNWFNIKDSEIDGPKFFLRYDKKNNEEEESSDGDIFEEFSYDSSDSEGRKYDDEGYSISSSDEHGDDSNRQKEANFVYKGLFPFSKSNKEIKINANPDLESTSGSSMFDSTSHNPVSSYTGQDHTDTNYPRPIYNEPRLLPRSPQRSARQEPIESAEEEDESSISIVSENENDRNEMKETEKDSDNAKPNETKRNEEEDDEDVEIDNKSDDNDEVDDSKYVYIRYEGEKKQIEIKSTKLPRSYSFIEMDSKEKRPRRFSAEYDGPEVKTIFESEGGVSVQMGISMIDVVTVCHNCSFDLFGPDIDFASALATCAKPGELAMGQVVFEHVYDEGYRIKQVIADLEEYGQFTVYCIRPE